MQSDLAVGVAELRAEVLQAEVLLQEFLNADVVVLGAPMNNFGMSSRLKSWLDRVLPKITIEPPQKAEPPAAASFEAGTEPGGA